MQPFYAKFSTIENIGIAFMILSYRYVFFFVVVGIFLFIFISWNCHTFFSWRNCIVICMHDATEERKNVTKKCESIHSHIHSKRFAMISLMVWRIKYIKTHYGEKWVCFFIWWAGKCERMNLIRCFSISEFWSEWMTSFPWWILWFTFVWFSRLFINSSWLSRFDYSQPNSIFFWQFQR